MYSTCGQAFVKALKCRVRVNTAFQDCGQILRQGFAALPLPFRAIQE